MKLQIPEGELFVLEKEILCLQPWMHPYQFSDQVLTGYFKYHGIEETCCVSLSPPDLIKRLRDAFNDYMSEQPYFFMDHIVDLLGSDMRSCSFLDIACATGRFSFYLALQGASRVYGVEIRAHQIEQCELIRHFDPRFQDLNITFENVTTSADDSAFLQGHCYDVVLSMGLLYHLVNPLQHLRNLYRLTNRVALVHSLTHQGPSGYWTSTSENPAWMTKSIDGISRTPYFKDVPDLLQTVGFKRVEFLVHPLLSSIQTPLLSDTASSPSRWSGIQWRALNLMKNMARLLLPKRARRVIRSLLYPRRTQKPSFKYLNPNYFTYLAFKE